jgi:hypothetical protein
MMEKKVFETRLEILLMSKAFNNLTGEEKKYVLTFLTEEEYQEYSLILSNYKPALLGEYDQIQPSPKVLETLTHAFSAKNNVNSQRPVYLNFTRPQGLLTAAATLIILVGCLFIFPHVNKKEQPLTVKINKPHSITISKALKKEVQEIKKYSSNPRKRKTHFYAGAAKKTDNNLCLDIPVITANNILIDTSNIPCLNPINTMLLIPKTNSLPGLN